MNGLRNWVFEQLSSRFPEQFSAATGMSVAAMRDAIARGDASARERVRAAAARMQQEQPNAWQNAEAWAKQNFPPTVGTEKQTQPNNPK